MILIGYSHQRSAPFPSAGSNEVERVVSLNVLMFCSHDPISRNNFISMLTKLFSLPNVSCDILGSWLDLKSVVYLDSAVCNHSARGQLIHLLSCKGLVHQNPVLLRGTDMLQWLYSKSFRLSAALFGIETEHSCLLIRYFASFGDCVHSVHFRDECNEPEMMYLTACYCKYITVLRCSNVTLPYAFHAILQNNPHIQEIWIHYTDCGLDGLMDDLSLDGLRLLSVESVVCSKGFPWSISAFSNSLRRVECNFLAFYSQDIAALTQNCMNINSFSLRNMDNTDENVRNFLGAGLELVNLDLSINLMITDDAVLFIAQTIPSLRTLNIQKCKSLTSASLMHIAEHARQLEVLYCDIKDPSAATEQSVEIFSHKCTILKYLNICSNFVLCSTTCSLSLIKGCPALHTLVINAHKNISPTTRGLCAILRPHLKILVHDESLEYNVLTLPI